MARIMKGDDSSLNSANPEPGDLIEMDTCYPGTQGIIKGKISGLHELYLIELKNNLRIVAGPASFKLLNKCLTQE